MNKRYFNWLVRSNKIPVLFYGIIYLGIATTSVLTDTRSQSLLTGTLGLSGAVSFGTAAVLPILLFNYAQRKSNVDRMFALPLSRKEHLITNLTFGFVLSFGSWLLIAALLSLYFYRYISIPGLLFAILMQALCNAMILILDTFLFLLGNSLFDGIVMVGAYNLLGLVIYATICGGLSSLVIGIDPTSVVADKFMYLCPGYLAGFGIAAASEGCVSGTTNILLSSIPVLIFILLYTLIGIIGVKKEFIERKSERAEQISDHPLAYPFLIHCYLALILFYVGSGMQNGFSSSVLIVYVIMLAVYIFSMVVYKRKVSITPRILLTYGAIALATYAFALIGYKTYGFGIAKINPVDISEDLVISYNASDSTYTNNINFYLEIPAGKTEDYQEVLDLVESHRTRTIESYYHYDSSYISNNGYLYMSNSKTVYDPDTISHSYTTQYNSVNYYQYEPFTLEELEVIDKYTPVEAYDYDTGESMTLKEYKRSK